jgi:hypothetical protein
METNYDKLIKDFSKHASESSAWASALAQLLLAHSVETWLQACCAELSRIADALAQQDQ